MDRIIIAISNLNKESWVAIYKFIKSIVDEGITLETKNEAFNSLRRISIGIRQNSNVNSTTANDVYSLYGKELSDNNLYELNKDTCFSILYQKNNASDDFTELVPFILLQHEFGNAISLGIDVGSLDLEDQKRYKFKCSDFFILQDIRKPRMGNRSLYFVNEKKINKDTGELIELQTSSLAGKSEKKTNIYLGTSSRRFLPLIKITEDNYKTIFAINTKGNSSSRELDFITDSIKKIRRDWENTKSSKRTWANLKSIFDSSESVFSQWLESGFFYSYENELNDIKTDEIQGVKNTLEIYKNSILELIQNVIFHGGKEGLLYCVFDKKENISDSYKGLIANFDEYDLDTRFLRIGILDFGKTGIVDTFLQNRGKRICEIVGDSPDSLSLNDFFDTNSIVTTGLNRLDMRYAARMGIKTFVKTIIEHKGYFSVESNVFVGNNNLKKNLKTVLKNRIPTLIYDDNPFVFADGTHYEIVLPVKASEIHPSVPLQRVSLLRESFKQSYRYLSIKSPLQTLNLSKEDLTIISNSLSKDEQITWIRTIGTRLIQNITMNQENKDNKVIVLNLGSDRSDYYNIIFKLVAFLQLNVEHGIEKVILVATDSFVKGFYGIVNNIAIYPVWSRNSAIILLSNNLNTKIIWGETKDELYYINNEFQKRYFNYFYSSKSVLDILPHYKVKDVNIIKRANRFILPLYDLIIKIDNEGNNNLSLFESFVYKLLKTKIDSAGIGFLVSHKNTYIGNKIIVRNYYEADMMFQNNFFTERFACLIASNISKEVKGKTRKNLVLIGYKHYSEYLLKSIKKILAEENIFSNVFITILNEEKETVTNDKFVFNFDIDIENGKNIQNEIREKTDNFYYISIVPIGATLSTNDKIVALFKKEFFSNIPEYDNNFIYNHCVIVVRDGCEKDASELEIGQKWSSKNAISFSDRIINTNYNNIKKIHYNLLLSDNIEDSKTKGKKCSCKYSTNWERRLNNRISFPVEWWKEEYVNFTENSSINSQNLMGFPNVILNKDENTREIDHEEELNRLYELKDDIYKGHIEVLNCHHKYYIDTEMFVKRKKNDALKDWLEGLKIGEKSVFCQDYFNVIVTPNVERESDFVCAVNSLIFNDSALIIYLDVNNWRNNMVYKLSFLKDLHNNKNIRYHYVDHAFLTGETFHKSKRYLLSIVGELTNESSNNSANENHIGVDKKEFRFDSIITIVNRLPYAKCQEVKNDVINNMFAYVNLYYPTSRQGEDNCELCKLMNYYKELSKKTVLDSCINVINKNLAKIQITNKNKINRGMWSKRNFLRLILTHEIYYRIAEIAQKNLDNSHIFDDIYKNVVDELDGIYSQLSYKGPNDIQTKIPRSNINKKIDDWLLPMNYPNEGENALRSYYKTKMEVDKKISFLKVVSSLPLSQYISIRKYAHEKLLQELYAIIKQTNNEEIIFTYDDLKIIKSIIKSLSFLKSNALVRKDVIVGIWIILKKVVENLEKEKYTLNCTLNRIEEQMLFLTKQNKGGKKNQLDLFEKAHSLEGAKEIDNDLWRIKLFYNELERDMKSLNAETIIQDFSKDIQFYIKNSIIDDDAKATFLGELLRGGEEIKDFSRIEIKKTKLSLKKDMSENSLFCAFPEDDLLSKEYTYFLVWLFYDNTTIIRKTLENFSKEIGNKFAIRGKLHELFYEVIENGYKLIDFHDFIKNQKKIFELFKNKVEVEYYYSSFKPYIENGDKIDYIEKLIYVTYAKLKLEDLTTKKSFIEKDTHDLMEIFAAIMGADAAFWTMKKDSKDNNEDSKKNAKDIHLYPISLYDKDYENRWDYDLWNLADSYYTYEIYKQKIYYPLIAKYRINQIHGEKRDLKKHSLGVFVISDNRLNNNNNVVSSITFLYNTSTSDEKEFRVKFQESGRLLLLLKNDITKYVINYLIQEKGFELWEKIYLNSRKFEKIYANSSHVFNRVYEEMDEFENLDESIIKRMSRTWFFLSNETISFLYSTIEKDPRHYLNLDNYYVVDKNNTLGHTFNNSFICILSALLDSRWKGEKNNIRNIIYINGIPLEEFQIADNLKDIKIGCNKHLIRTFIAQCIHNSLSTIGNHGHRYSNEIKKVDIILSESKIVIKDSSLIDIPKEVKAEQARLFLRKKKYIRDLKCEEYSSTTLTSLQGFANYMQFTCKYGFTKDNNFEVSIKFNKSLTNNKRV